MEAADRGNHQAVAAGIAAGNKASPAGAEADKVSRRASLAAAAEVAADRDSCPSAEAEAETAGSRHKALAAVEEDNQVEAGILEAGSPAGEGSPVAGEGIRVEVEVRHSHHGDRPTSCVACCDQ